MSGAIYMAAAGAMAYEKRMQVISNNLANINTSGFKKSRAEFQDLLSQTLKAPGAQVAQGTFQPTGIQVGLGVKNSAIQRVNTAGIMKATDNRYSTTRVIPPTATERE